MAGRKIRDAADARACLSAAARARGMTRAEWAREHGIDGRSLNSWRVNLERGSAKPTKKRRVRLVELVAAPPVQPVRYVIRLGDVAVEFDQHFDDATLRRVLQVVAAC